MVDFLEIKVDLDGMPDFYFLIEHFSFASYKYRVSLYRKGSPAGLFSFYSNDNFYLFGEKNINLRGVCSFNIVKDCVGDLDALLFEKEGRHLSGFDLRSRHDS